MHLMGEKDNNIMNFFNKILPVTLPPVAYPGLHLGGDGGCTPGGLGSMEYPPKGGGGPGKF